MEERPPMSQFAQLRRTDDGFQALLSYPNHIKKWALPADEVKAHFATESAWLDRVGPKFVHIPETGSFPKSVAAALEYAGDVDAARAARDAVDASFLAKDRLKFTAQEVLRKCNYEPRKIIANTVLEVPTEHPTIVTLRTSKGIRAAALFEGILFDGDTLEATSEWGTTRVDRGYAFVPQLKAQKRKRES